jgi:hypothetical protein
VNANPDGPPPRSGLNPSLKAVDNASRDTETPTPTPAESASVQSEEGRSWPVIWLVATALCVLIAVFLLF